MYLFGMNMYDITVCCNTLPSLPVTMREPLLLTISPALMWLDVMSRCLFPNDSAPITVRSHAVLLKESLLNMTFTQKAALSMLLF